MKKTMLALMATVGLAFGAKAVNSTGFENYTDDFAYDLNDSGEALAPRYWVVTNATDLGVTDLTAYGESAKPAYVPWAFTNTVNDTYLKVDTNNEVLYRSVEEVNDVSALNAGTAIGDGLYFDANVQFTASDGDVDPADGDKLIVWLKATEGETPTTNLVVTAGVLNGTSGEYDPTQFEIDGTYSADTWYRLTVKAMIDDGLTKFVVYVDDEQLTVGGTAAVFNSLVQTGDNKATLTAVGFKGTGAVDNLVWTTDDPFPVVEPTTVNFSLTVTDEDTGADSITYKVGEDDPIMVIGNVVESTAIAVEEQSITIAVTVLDDEEGTYDVAATLNGEACSVITGTKENDLRTDTITIDIRGYETGSAVAVVVTITEAAPPTPPTPSEDEKEIAPGGKGSIADETGDTYTKEAVEDMVTVVAPNADSLSEKAKAAFDNYFTKDASYNSTTKKWEVTVTLDKETLEADVDDAVEAALEAVVGDAETKAVAIPAGFYYKIEHGATVGLTGEPLTGTSTGSVAMPALGEDAGFFKVSVDTTSFGE